LVGAGGQERARNAENHAKNKAKYKAKKIKLISFFLDMSLSIQIIIIINN
jgi:hypothetical protein